MNGTKSTREIAADIRSSLKAASIRASVRVHEYSMGATVIITLRDFSVVTSDMLAKVEAIAKANEQVTRDAQGLELCGGGVHVEVTTPEGLCECCAKPTYWHKHLPAPFLAGYVCSECEITIRLNNAAA